jgi:uncharacterized protein YqgC (DUF456 family)
MLQPLNDVQFAVLAAFVFVAMLLGLAGIILPVAPGLVLVWAAALLYGVLVGVAGWSWFYLVLITLLMLGGYGLSSFTAQLGAAKTGTSWQANAVGCLFGVVGFFILPVLGAVVGALLGIFLVEYYRTRQFVVARNSTIGAFLGFLAGYGVQIVAACLMISTWILWVLAEGINLF